MSELLFLWITLFLYLEITALPFYQQKDYDVKGDRVEVTWYNNSIFKDVNMNYYWYNRTQKAFNATGYLLSENATTDVVVELQMYKFMSNEYREFPLRLALNFCEEYAKNNFNIKNLLKNISNMHDCPLQKGLYYVYNLKPDFTLLPPFIPRGKYKAHVKLFYNKQFVGEGNAYGEVLDKPLAWN